MITIQIQNQNNNNNNNINFCGSIQFNSMVSLSSICRAFKSFLTRKHHHHHHRHSKHHHPSPPSDPHHHHQSNDNYDHISHVDDPNLKAKEDENKKKKTLNSPSLRNNRNDTSTSTSTSKEDGLLNSSVPSTLSRSATTTQSRNGPSPLSSNTSQRSKSGPIGTLLKSMSKKHADPAPSATLSRSASRAGHTPIMYSNSTGFVRPPDMEKQLECTLDELCLGCTKKVTITRDVVKDNGQIVQEDEELTIKVKPGWTKGTKIKFEGMGNETPGTKAADLNFIVAEKKHQLFRREGDDLRLAIELPLEKALTGCTLSIPLVGGEVTSLKIDDIVFPGYEKIIEGQGMPMAKVKGKRGNLIVQFGVQFPEKLTDEQRSGVYRILQSSFDQGNPSP